MSNPWSVDVEVFDTKIQRAVNLSTPFRFTDECSITRKEIIFNLLRAYVALACEQAHLLCYSRE